jgi:hypothetical protein
MSRSGPCESSTASEQTRLNVSSTCRSQRATLNVNDRHGNDDQREKQTMRRTDSSKRREKSAKNSLDTTSAFESNTSKQKRSNMKMSLSHVEMHDASSKRETSATSEIEQQAILTLNDSQQQNLAGSGLIVVPSEIFER